MPKVKKYLKTTGAVIGFSILGGLAGLGSYYLFGDKGLIIETQQHYNQEGELVPVSRIEIDGMRTIRECIILMRHTSDAEFKSIVNENLEGIVLSSELPVREQGNLGTPQYANPDRVYIDVDSGDPVAVKILAQRLQDNICNPPGQKMNSHQIFNQHMYGENGVLLLTYAPKKLGL